MIHIHIYPSLRVWRCKSYLRHKTADSFYSATQRLGVVHIVPQTALCDLSAVLCVVHCLHVCLYLTGFIYIYLTFFIHIPQTDSRASAISAHGEISAESSAPHPVSMET